MKNKLWSFSLLFFVFGFIWTFIDLTIKCLMQGEFVITFRILYSLFIVGGLIGASMGLLNEFRNIRDLPPAIQMIICACLASILELGLGLIFNRDLLLWSYIDLPFNIMGLASLPTTFIWFVLSPLAIIIDDEIRNRL